MTPTFTFDNLLIKPKAHSRVKSRAMVDTTTTFYDVDLPMPVLSASMSLFDTHLNGTLFQDFANAMYEAGGLHILSRGSSLRERLDAARALPDTGIEFGIAVSYQEFQAHQAVLEDTEAFISIDIANGAIIENIDWQGKYPLIVGNFGNPGVLQRRDLKGELIYKFGIGSGSGCTTREVTGVGAPQGWLINEAMQTGWHEKPIISDGGVKHVGDFVKAIALGADAVMLGRMFAGTTETPWSPVKFNGQWYKPYRGMASAEEKQSNSFVEGISGYVPYEGKSVKDVMQELSDGLRSAMAYVDALDLIEFRSQVEFFSVPEGDRETETRLYTPPLSPEGLIGY